MTDNWISVKDRKPIRGEHVIAYNPDADWSIFSILWGDWLIDRGVTDWMPMPKKPNEPKGEI